MQRKQSTNDLPIELWHYIVSFLRADDLVALRQTSTEMKGHADSQGLLPFINHYLSSLSGINARQVLPAYRATQHYKNLKKKLIDGEAMSAEEVIWLALTRDASLPLNDLYTRLPQAIAEYETQLNDSVLMHLQLIEGALDLSTYLIDHENSDNYFAQDDKWQRVDGFFDKLQKINDQIANNGFSPFLNLSGIVLRGLSLNGNFSGVCLDGADFSRSSIESMDLRSASLRGATFESASLSVVLFNNADLCEANFDLVNLSSMTVLEGAVFFSATHNFNQLESELEKNFIRYSKNRLLQGDGLRQAVVKDFLKQVDSLQGVSSQEKYDFSLRIQEKINNTGPSLYLFNKPFFCNKLFLCAQEKWLGENKKTSRCSLQ